MTTLVNVATLAVAALIVAVCVVPTLATYDHTRHLLWLCTFANGVGDRSSRAVTAARTMTRRRLTRLSCDEATMVETAARGRGGGAWMAAATALH